MTVKEHLSQHHAKSASFDVGIGAELEKLGKVFASLEQAGDDELKDIYTAGKDSVRRLSAAFNQHAAYHRDMAAGVEKGESIEDLNKLVPTRVSAVYDPTKNPTGSRLVNRAGQPDVSMPRVDPMFEGLVKVGDDRDLAG